MTKYVKVNLGAWSGFNKEKNYEVLGERSINGAQFLLTNEKNETLWVHHSNCGLVCNTPETRKTSNKISSDGGSTAYYDLPAKAKTLYDIIDNFNMNFSEGNVLKAVYRMGRKEGVDQLYDWRKIKFAAEREIARLEKLNATSKE